MKYLFLIFASILNQTFCLAAEQTVYCSGFFMEDGERKEHTVKFTINAEGVSEVTEDGIMVFSTQTLGLEEYNSLGQRPFDHLGYVQNFRVRLPTEGNGYRYSYSAFGEEFFMLTGDINQVDLLVINVGRFQKGELSEARCEMTGVFGAVDQVTGEQAPLEGFVIQ